MSNENKTTTTATTTDSTPKMTMSAKIGNWFERNPAKGTLITATGGGLAAMGVVKAGTAIKDHFAEKATEPARDQAAGFVKGALASFGRFGK